MIFEIEHSEAWSPEVPGDFFFNFFFLWNQLVWNPSTAPRIVGFGSIREAVIFFSVKPIDAMRRWFWVNRRGSGEHWVNRRGSGEQFHRNWCRRCFPCIFPCLFYICILTAWFSTWCFVCIDPQTLCGQMQNWTKRTWDLYPFAAEVFRDANEQLHDCSLSSNLYHKHEDGYYYKLVSIRELVLTLSTDNEDSEVKRRLETRQRVSRRVTWCMYVDLFSIL